MKLQHVEQVAVYYEADQARRVKVGRLAVRGREILFEYDTAFLATRLELSPFHLPLRTGVTVGKSDVLDGLMGVFDDSLPDGWGKLLIDRRAGELGLSGGALTALDRLTLVGARSMGALTYEPEVALDMPSIVELSELAREAEGVFRGASGPDLERLIAVGGSPKGARPKVLVQIAPNGDIHFGATTIQDGFTAWLVKFRGPDDDAHIASLEHAYFLMAREAGVRVPSTQVLGGTKRKPGYFAIERFDRDGSRRIHAHTLGGLLHLPHGYPALDYSDLLKVTRRLTRNEEAVGEMFRRACFNVFAHNRDDHSRNFAFLMNPNGEWNPSPAYDLTFSSGPGGQHTMLVDGEGRAPEVRHLESVAASASVKKAANIIDEVRSAVGRFGEFADQARLPAKLRKATVSALKTSGR